MSTSDLTLEQRGKQASRTNTSFSVPELSPQAVNAPVVADSYWVPDLDQMSDARRQKPWRADPHFFTSVSVSLAATVKMFMHGTRGCPDISQGRFNWFEVMGLLIGHFRDRELVLTDSFSLPVAASEVECSMTEASQIYMANYLEYHRSLGKAEPGCVGWYHTHPGYSCFLSGIDVMTQQGSQRMQDPWVAIVIDPVETLRTGEFSMKAFRTYPEGYTPSEAPARAGSGREKSEANNASSASGSPLNGASGASGSSFGLPPTNRIKDFGMHAHRYYELPVKVVQSSRDAPLWASLQQHFWPLSLSLTFPYAPSTRTCQCCSQELVQVIAKLGELRGRGRTGAAAPNLLDMQPRSGRVELGGAPLLYRTNVSTRGGEQREDGQRGGSIDFESLEESRAAAARRLLTVAEKALRAKAESFSLMDTTQPTHLKLLEALRVVSAVSKDAAPPEAP